MIAVHQIPPPSLSPSVSPSFRFDVETKTNKKFRAKFVINCAGIPFILLDNIIYVYLYIKHIIL